MDSEHVSELNEGHYAKWTFRALYNKFSLIINVLAVVIKVLHFIKARLGR